jgi:hypothetical protein
LEERDNAIADLLTSHPPIYQRIALLYRMAGIAQPLEDRSTAQGSTVQSIQ